MTHAYESPVVSARSISSGAVAGTLTALFTIGVGAANGGYFPTSWGWSGLALAWIAIVLLLLRDDLALARLPFAFVCAGGAFVAWVALSTLWSVDVPQTVLEIERDVVYVAAALLFVLLARSYAGALVVGALVGIVAVCGYALLTRLLPDRLGAFDAVAVYRLSSPVGYWNALGLFAAFGSLLALGVLTWSRSGIGRSGAAAGLVLLLPTQYFTFSRGAWLALAIGVAVLVALEPRRLRLLAAAAVAAPAPAIAVVLASRSPALTRRGADLATAAHDGHRVALAIAGLAVVGAVLGFAFGVVADRIRVVVWVERAANATVAAVVVLALVGVIAQYGSPTTWPQRTWDAFAAAPVRAADLNSRLFSFSGNGRVLQWHVGADQVRDYPTLGSGAGSFERYWVLHRPNGGKIRDVHNLYLEVLAELGPVGLALLVAFLGLPLLALRRARRAPYGAAAAGVYVAYLAHAGVDWDWEMLALTLPALLCGAILLTAGREAPPLGRGIRFAAVGTAFVIAVVAFVGLVGNVQLSRAATAARDGNWQSASAHARKAHTWAPWSSQPWQQLGEAQMSLGEMKSARQSFRRAIAKNPRDWSIWFDLARATTDRAQAAALAQAKRLNPLSPEIATLEEELAQQGLVVVK